MRWTTSVILVINIFSLVSSAETDPAAPYLHIMTKTSAFNVGEKKAVYCEGLNMVDRLDWYTPSNTIVESRSSKNTRVYVERPKNESASTILLVLIFHSTKIKDSGNWTCKAGPLSASIEVLVGEKVNLGVKHETAEGEESKSMRLDCVAKGYPLPVVQWYKDSVLIVDDHKKYTVRKKDDNYQLEIKNLTHQDSGDYMCKVTQKALSYYTYKRVMVSVQHKPLLVDYATNEIYYTKYRTEEVYAILNETKNITCSSIAHPPPTYQWFKRENENDKPIEDEDMVLHSADGTSSVLMLRLYNTSYLGEYKCSASNPKGHVSIMFHVSLGNKPNAPDFVSLVSATASNFTFNVTCSTCKMEEDDDFAPPDPQDLIVLGYSFEFVPVKEGYIADWDQATEYLADVVSSNDTLFTVGPLANLTTYHGRVRTRNAAGFSEWLEISPNPTTAGAIKMTDSIFLLIITIIISYY